MLTSGSSAEQRVQIRATTASTTTTPVRWWCLAGGCGRKRECWGNVGITENVFVGGKMDNGECRYMRERILFE
jgi:hypothetical protein